MVSLPGRHVVPLAREPGVHSDDVEGVSLVSLHGSVASGRNGGRATFSSDA